MCFGKFQPSSHPTHSVRHCVCATVLFKLKAKTHLFSNCHISAWKYFIPCLLDCINATIFFNLKYFAQPLNADTETQHSKVMWLSTKTKTWRPPEANFFIILTVKIIKIMNHFSQWFRRPTQSSRWSNCVDRWLMGWRY